MEIGQYRALRTKVWEMLIFRRTEITIPGNYVRKIIIPIMSETRGRKFQEFQKRLA